MPNWCSNRFVIYGDKGQLLKCYMDMSNAISEHPNFKPVDNSWDRMWIGNLFLEAGYDNAEVENGRIACRGGINNLELTEDRIILDDETAWGPNDESMQRLLDEKYPGLQMVFQCEEPGMDIYINSDQTGDYLPDKFLLDAYCDNNYFESVYEGYESADDLLRGVADMLDVTVKVLQNELKAAGVNSVADADWEAIARKLKNIPDDVDCFVGVHGYELG